MPQKRKKRGRPATGTDPLVGTRMPRDLIRDIDRWAHQNTIGSRSEAIRRLVELGLANAQRATARSNKIAKASEMAGQEIDRLSDPLATDEERQIRKRRLIKGPKEFLDIRSNRAKIKG
jgi:Arc/MetJ-type ribon-helix-helix transcriptional regulator